MKKKLYERTSLMLDGELSQAIKQIQADLMLTSTRHWTFSQVLNGVIANGLKNKKEAKEMCQKYIEGGN